MSSSKARYKKTRSVGKGSFGQVWLVEDVQNGEKLVMKEVMLKGLPPAERASTMHEVAVLQRLCHPCIVRYRDSFVDDGDKLCICMEYASGGDLSSKICALKKQRGRFSEGEVLRILGELVSALAYLHHEAKLLHRDLKPANIFLTADGSCLLGDFGISKQLQVSCQLARTQCGTPIYMSPEMCAGKDYDRSADVWAYGCCLFECLSLKDTRNYIINKYSLGDANNL